MSSIDKINVGGVDFDINSSPTPVMAPVETGTTATQPYAVGDYVIVGSTLHEVTAAIAIGGTFTEGTNISTSTSLGDEIKQLNNDLTDYSVNTPLRNVTYYNGKLYQITSTGQRGSEIKMGTLVPSFKSADKLQSFTGTNVNTVSYNGFLIVESNAGGTLYINNEPIALIGANPYPYYVRVNDTVRCDVAPNTFKVVRAVMVTA